MRVALIAIALLISTLGARGYFDDGNDLLRICAHDALGMCMGQITGHYDMMVAVGFVCANTKGVNKQQVKDIVLKYLRDHPAKRHQPSASLTIAAMTDAFNCRFNGQKVESSPR
jgi:hypothetical protein